MRDTLFMLLLLVLPVIQVTMLVKGIKHKYLGFYALAVDILSIVIAASMLMYYEALPGYGFMPGLTYLFEALMCMAAMVLYGFIMFVTGCSKIIMFERRLKRDGKTHSNPVVLTVAFICIVGAAVLFAYEKYENRNIVYATGTVVDFKEDTVTFYENGVRVDKTYICPVIDFEIDGKTYRNSAYPFDFEEELEKGDTVEIYCEPTVNNYSIILPQDIKCMYLTLLGIACLLFIYRVIKSAVKSGKAETGEKADDEKPNDGEKCAGDSEEEKTED